MCDPDEQLRTEIQRMIVRIIISGADRERMTEMLRNVHKDEAWPTIWRELDELALQEQGGRGKLWLRVPA